jgi:hypothetical protein
MIKIVMNCIEIVYLLCSTGKGNDLAAEQGVKMPILNFAPNFFAPKFSVRASFFHLANKFRKACDLARKDLAALRKVWQPSSVSQLLSQLNMCHSTTY